MCLMLNYNILQDIFLSQKTKDIHFHASFCCSEKDLFINKYVCKCEWVSTAFNYELRWRADFFFGEHYATPHESHVPYYHAHDHHGGIFSFCLHTTHFSNLTCTFFPGIIICWTFLWDATCIMMALLMGSWFFL